MATIDSKAFVDELIRLDGQYQDDEPIFRIVEYTNMAGRQTWGIEYERDLGKYCESEYVRKPRAIWRKEKPWTSDLATPLLLKCPFCGSDDIDPEGWASKDRHGPACNECGGSADSIEGWNKRATQEREKP